MRTADFDYELPEELVASHPLERREDSRMLVVDRASGEIHDSMFCEIGKWLGRDDLLVLNNTRVLASRFFDDTGKMEIVRLEARGGKLWKCMVRPGKKLRPGKTVEIGGAVGTVESVDDEGNRYIRFDREVDEARGMLALPHYMGRNSEPEDAERYQTVYADKEGAIAAPTAGLHFTPEILGQFDHTFVTLHVGIGTFRPVKVEDVAEHVMHREVYELTAEAADRINAAGRVVAVGTTVVRVLEHLARTQPGWPPLRAESGETGIFIYPPYSFREVDALLTNFHLPQSTLLMLVSAFAGKDLVFEAYRKAIELRYRFFSYGDCMLIL